MRRLHIRQIVVIMIGLMLVSALVWRAGEVAAPQEKMTMRAADNQAVAGERQPTDSIVSTAGDSQRADGVVNTLASRADEPTKKLTGEVVRGFGWQEEDGVWRYHTGVDIRYEGAVPAPVEGTVTRVETVVGGYRIELTQEGKQYQYEPLTDVSCAVGDAVASQAILGRVAGILHIACKRDGKWIPWQNQP